jgi:hypothetical protein
MLSIETVDGHMIQVMRRKLKVVRVHVDQLVDAVQEEDEERRVLLAVVHVGPCLHLQPRCLQVRGHVGEDLTLLELVVVVEVEQS